MPLSFGEWSSRDCDQGMNFEQPCFSRGIVGKRKLTVGSDADWSMDDGSVCPEKRACVDMVNPFITPSPTLPQSMNGFHHMPAEENNNNNNNNNNNGSIQNFMESHDMQMISEQQINQIVPDISYNQSLQTNDLIMDINDQETYSAPPTAPGTPSVTSQSLGVTSHTTEAQVHHTHAQFCRDFCGNGTVSPRSGHVRCYCKPSWEGMMGINAYFSDIY